MHCIGVEKCIARRRLHFCDFFVTDVQALHDWRTLGIYILSTKRTCFDIRFQGSLFFIYSVLSTSTYHYHTQLGHLNLRSVL